jgi:glyoxylate reductase
VLRKVLVTGDFSIGNNVFPEDFELIHIRCPVDEQQILDVLPEVQDYILGGPEYLSPRLLDGASRLENVVVMGTSIASFVDIEYATKKGIRLANTPDMNIQAVVEFALAMIIASLAKVFESIQGVKEGTHWLQTPRRSLSTLNIGFIGMGAIGSVMAQQLHLRGCRNMQYWSRNRKEELEESLGLQFNSVASIVSTVDILCIHVTSCKETRHLIDEAVLQSTSPTLSIFNFSSPTIIHPGALKEFLLGNSGAFCFIDGYYNEWIDNKGQYDDAHGLLSLPSDKLVVTSHLAAQEQETINKIFARAATRIIELAGEEIKQ